MVLLIEGLRLPNRPTTMTVFPDGKVQFFCGGTFKQTFWAEEIPAHGDLVDKDELLDECPELLPYEQIMRVVVKGDRLC